MKSRIFSTDVYCTIEVKVRDLLNAHADFLSPSTAGSTRAVGDAIENILEASFDTVLGDLCSEYSAGFARRAMADLAFKDGDGFYYVVDVKTHRTDTRFNMPNLTSVERLARFYQDDTNYFILLIVRYRIEATTAVVGEVRFVPIEFLSWDSLTVGALGWGQIQITDANRIDINPQNSRRQWMLDLCDVMLSFYPREIEKIGARMDYFERARQFWLAKPEG